MKIDYCSFCEIGSRETNQDMVFAEYRDGVGIFAVADGMGGHSGGEIASDAVIKAIKEWRNSPSFAADIDHMGYACSDVIKKTSRKLYDEFHEKGEIGGTTAVVLLVSDKQYRILSVGDSRAYSFGTFSLRQMTEDDVWENSPDVKKKLSVQDIINSPQRGKLTAAVGGMPEIGVHIYGGKLKAKENFVLCSDGVYKFCGAKNMKKVFKKSAFCNSKDTAIALRQMAVDCEAADNFSAVICKIKR